MVLEHILGATLWLAIGSEPAGMLPADNRPAAEASSGERPGLLTRIRERFLVSRRERVAERTTPPNSAPQQPVTPAGLEMPEPPGPAQSGPSASMWSPSRQTARPSTLAPDGRGERTALWSHIKGLLTDRKRDVPAPVRQAPSSKQVVQPLVDFEPDENAVDRVDRAPIQPAQVSVWDPPAKPPIKSRVIRPNPPDAPMAPAEPRRPADQPESTSGAVSDSDEQVEAVPAEESQERAEAEPADAEATPGDQTAAPDSDESASNDSDPVRRLLARVSARGVGPGVSPQEQQPTANASDSEGEDESQPAADTSTEQADAEVVLAQLPSKTERPAATADAFDETPPAGTDSGEALPSKSPFKSSRLPAASRTAARTASSETAQGDIAEAIFSKSRPAAPKPLPAIALVQEKPHRTAPGRTARSISAPLAVGRMAVNAAKPEPEGVMEASKGTSDSPAERVAASKPEPEPQATVRSAGWFAWTSRVKGLPIEYYLPVLVLLLGVGFMAHSRGRRSTPQGDGSVPAATSHPVQWPAMGSRIDPDRYREPAGAQPAHESMFGAFTTVVGLAVVAVGITAVLRAQLGRQSDLFRPGMVVAAAGQFVLLVGIMALAAQSLRRSRTRRAGSLEALTPELAHVMAPAMATSSSFPASWPAAAPSSNGSGQIAQLKAQLDCLSQQLDHLHARS